jgi:hypothetical protein
MCVCVFVCLCACVCVCVCVYARDRAAQVVYDGDDMHRKAGIGKHPLT